MQDRAEMAVGHVGGTINGIIGERPVPFQTKAAKQPT